MIHFSKKIIDFYKKTRIETGSNDVEMENKTREICIENDDSEDEFLDIVNNMKSNPTEKNKRRLKRKLHTSLP